MGSSCRRRPPTSRSGARTTSPACSRRTPAWPTTSTTSTRTLPRRPRALRSAEPPRDQDRGLLGQARQFLGEKRPNKRRQEVRLDRGHRTHEQGGSRRRGHRHSLRSRGLSLEGHGADTRADGLGGRLGVRRSGALRRASTSDPRRAAAEGEEGAVQPSGDELRVIMRNGSCDERMPYSIIIRTVLFRENIKQRNMLHGNNCTR